MTIGIVGFYYNEHSYYVKMNENRNCSEASIIALKGRSGMKKLGLVGGLGPESTVEYYKMIIGKYQARMNSKETLPEFYINSINMYKVFSLIESGNLNGLADYLVEAVEKLAQIGAEYAAISANTPHIVFNEVQSRVKIPMISIVEETFNKSKALGIERVGLIGTKFTMENEFFKTPFIENSKAVFVPTPEEQRYMHGKIVTELENGIVKEDTKQKFQEIIQNLVDQHQIQGIILGCTELPMIIKPEDLSISELNTTELHIERIVEMMFS